MRTIQVYMTESIPGRQGKQKSATVVFPEDGVLKEEDLLVYVFVKD